ncbi:MAG: 23S rRNA (guanosine(2251)-2'-O)-methyltransferase RlmB, partial [Deltaproteobacteria bacterium]|nr:23S rRNA (guanosine(2251)-2'-O)-methyltransferase RlmB [Deltaproteobacteria bacterium]
EAANLARFLDQARRKGFWVAGSVVEQGTPLDDFEHDQPLVLVLGNEGRGLRPLVRSQCDYLISIPLGGGGSLNVATAAAIMLYRLSRPRKP